MTANLIGLTSLRITQIANMGGKLKRIIGHYETEYQTLKTAIDDCVAEGDYHTAHRLAKGLRRLGRKLQILMNLQDPLHDAKQHAIRYIKGLEEMSAAESGRMLNYYQELIAAEKQKLANLEAQVPTQPTPPAIALHAALMKLADARITAFTLVLNEPQRLRLTVQLLRRTLLITLPEVRRHRAAYTLGKRHIRQLQTLGFRLYDDHDKLLLFLPFVELADIDSVKTVLARIAFDCFYFEELKGKSLIRYYEHEP